MRSAIRRIDERLCRNRGLLRRSVCVLQNHGMDVLTLPKPHVRTREIRENSRIAGIGRGLNAHRMVAETAVKLAYAKYEEWMAAHNEVRRAFLAIPSEKARQLAFVRQEAPQLLEEARLVLTNCLSEPDDIVPKHMKDDIAEALILDGDLRANRLKAAEHMPSGLLH